jgi:hypothetical protein
VLAAGWRTLVLLGSLLGSVGLAAALSEEVFVTLEALGIGVELDKGLEVLEWVLLGGLASRGGLDLWAEDTLDLVRVDETGNIRVGHLVTGEDVVTVAALLEAGVGRLVSRAEEAVKVSESRLGPDDEATNVASRGELKEVEGVDVASLDTRDVAEGIDKTVVVLVDNEWAAALGVAAVPPLALTRADLAGAGATVDVVVGTEAVQDSDGLLGLGDVLDAGSNNKGELWGAVNLVATGLDEGWDSGSREGSGGSVTALVLADTPVPVTPLLGGGEHATLAAHVTEGSLTAASVTRARNTGDT